ncbi:uncharacterized protein TNCV_4400471 [Trichonephila clavipes]|nr:uncharacterized protein TNCV_4400471 [Trichonephila clavipes]
MVWDAYSWRDIGPLIRLGMTLTGDRYVSILSDLLHPFMYIVHSDGLWEFQQDNATPHTSRIGTEGLQEPSTEFWNLDTFAGHQNPQQERSSPYLRSRREMTRQAGYRSSGRTVQAQEGPVRFRRDHFRRSSPYNLCRRRQSRQGLLDPEGSLRSIRSTSLEVHIGGERLDVSASKKKIEKSEGSFKDYEYEDNFSVDTQSRYVIIDLNVLNDIFNNIAKCRYCDKSFCFDVAENKSSRKGLATSVSATCKYCGSGHTSMTSNTVSDGYEVNLRFVYGMRCIGIGKSEAQIFCALMNLPPPPAKFERLYTPIFKALETVSSRSMVNSVNEADIENEHNKNIAIALDGTWQKRGHTSKNGVVTATSLDNGKVIDFECLSKYCFECKSTNKTCDNCQVNYHGFSAGMESEGALRIFGRSLPNYNVRYVQYLGDEDSKGFLRVQESNIYGDEFPVEKLECIGHVQKRMGARLRALKNNLKSTKLSDNKPISGRGRLTDAEILLLQKYYGLAIRRNVGKSIADMSKSIWAIYFH